mmetsp:Transcript_28441/g.48324  ORF Transcript_28441/g.48324 Transcript_28441/m.48324 type:complete len:332 (-) Transcript_28441:140-1135(-)
MCVLCKGEGNKDLRRHLENCWACPMCTRPVARQELLGHVEKCASWYSEDREEQNMVDKLRKAQTDLEQCQINALDHVKKEAKIASEKARGKVEARLKAMKINEADLDLVNRYIRNEAPIIIHFNCDKVLDFFVKDTHYRNLFETSTSGGSRDFTARQQWENTIFKCAYKNAKPFERPKYGVLNFANDPCGVRTCYHYGDSFLLLRNVRLRTTFAQKDTSSVRSVSDMATCEYYMHVMAAFNDAEIKDALKIARGDRKYVRRSSQVGYREVQIHGEVRFDRDVSCVIVNARHKECDKTIKKLESFQARHGVPYVWMSEGSNYRHARRIARKK